MPWTALCGPEELVHPHPVLSMYIECTLTDANASLEKVRLACVPECEHHHGAEEEPLESVAHGWPLRCPEDEVELIREQWHRDASDNLL